MMRVLVTGGCGFIGSNFIRWLLHSVPDVYILNVDALTYAGNLGNLADIHHHPCYMFRKADIADPEAVYSIFNMPPFDLIFNFAAETHVDRSLVDDSKFRRTNVVGTQNLIERARATRRFVQISTDEVYGSLGPDDPPFTEENPLQPRNPYSASKASADRLVLAAHHTSGLDTVITRCSNNYGPSQFPEKFIPLCITRAIEDRDLPIYGDGLQVRDWIHVLDHCRGIWAAATRGCAGEVYNFGGDSERTNIEIAYKILRLLGKPNSLIRKVADRPGHDRRYAMNFDKASRELGWKPAIPFDFGLANTVRMYLANRRA